MRRRAVNGRPIDLNRQATSGPTYLTEGVETGLSLLQADASADVKAMLSKSNFLNVDLTQLNGKVVLCLDNDGDATVKDGIIAKAALRILESGKSVSFMVPKVIGDDFNDVYKKEGPAAVKLSMESAMNAKTFFEGQINKEGSDASIKAGTKPQLPKLEENQILVKKLINLEANQIMGFQAHEIKNENGLKHIATLHKNSDASLAKKLNNIQTPKVQDNKTYDREIG